MRTYRASQKEASLAAVDYLAMVGAEVLAGPLTCTLRIDAGGLSGPLCAGVFGCTKGIFRLTFGSSELATLLEGRLRITGSDDRTTELKPGDSFFHAKGDTVTWEIIEDLVKCFMLVPNA
jgi:uncharacterized protein